MRRNFSALMIGIVVSLAIVSFANPDKPAVSPGAAQETSDDFLLLHDGDRVRVLFQKDAGPGSIRYRSLSNNSRLDILHTLRVEKYFFRKEDGWQTYPHVVGGQIVTIILRETGDNVTVGELPGCSDVVVRIEKASILSPHHTDGSDQGSRCNVCGAWLDWDAES